MAPSFRIIPRRALSSPILATRSCSTRVSECLLHPSPCPTACPRLLTLEPQLSQATRSSGTLSFVTGRSGRHARNCTGPGLQNGRLGILEGAAEERIKIAVAWAMPQARGSPGLRPPRSLCGAPVARASSTSKPLAGKPSRPDETCSLSVMAAPVRHPAPLCIGLLDTSSGSGRWCGNWTSAAGCSSNGLRPESTAWSGSQTRIAPKALPPRARTATLPLASSLLAASDHSVADDCWPPASSPSCFLCLARGAALPLLLLLILLGGALALSLAAGYATRSKPESPVPVPPPSPGSPASVIRLRGGGRSDHKYRYRHDSGSESDSNDPGLHHHARGSLRLPWHGLPVQQRLAGLLGS